MLRVKAGGFTSVALTPDGGRLVSAHVDGRLRLWDVADGRVLAETASGVSGAGLRAATLAMSADGRRLAIAGTWALALLYTLPDDGSAFVPGWPPGEDRVSIPIRCRIVVAPDGSCLFAATDWEIDRWDPFASERDGIFHRFGVPTITACACAGRPLLGRGTRE